MKVRRQKPRSRGIGVLAGTLLVLACSGPVRAAMRTPAWWGQAGTTYQLWRFNSDSNPSVPTGTDVTNSYGSPSAQVTVEMPSGTGWWDPLMYGSYAGEDGSWDLGSAGKIVGTVPFASAGSGTRRIDVFVDALALAVGGMVQLPTISVGGTLVTGSTYTVFEKNDSSWGGTWSHVIWTGQVSIVNNSSVDVTVQAGSSGAFVDTLSIHTRYPAGGPTSVVLSQFVACAENGKAMLRWRTASEWQTAGFDVYRLAGATWVRINENLIPATGLLNGGVGGLYELADAGAAAGGTYTYKIVERETGGTLREYGPYERQVTEFKLVSPIQPTPAGVQLRWLSRADEFYRVLAAPGPGGAFTPLATGLPATPPENTWIDRDPVGGVRIYKIEME